jgi:transposase
MKPFACNRFGIPIGALPGLRIVPGQIQECEKGLVDAEAICEAASRPSMRFVLVKNTTPQDVQPLHRICSRLIKWRTALANEIRSFLGEYGIVVSNGAMARLRRARPLRLIAGSAARYELRSARISFIKRASSS